MFTKNIFVFSFAVSMLLFAIGCNNIESQFMDETVETVDDTKKIGTVVIAATPEAWGTDAYVLNAATVQNDTLHINVSYTGGCETHAFTLVAEPIFLESFPVQLRVPIAHNANGDTCQDSLTEDYIFNLTPIKEAYQKGYQTDQGTIILRLKEAPPNNLAYDF